MPYGNMSFVGGLNVGYKTQTGENRMQIQILFPALQTSKETNL